MPNLKWLEKELEKNGYIIEKVSWPDKLLDLTDRALPFLFSFALGFLLGWLW